MFRNNSSSTYSKKPRRHRQRGNAQHSASLTTFSAQHGVDVPDTQGAEYLANNAPLEPRSFAQAVNKALYDQSFSSFITFCLPERASEDVPLAWLLSLYQGPVCSDTLSLAAAGVGYGWIGHEAHSSDALYCGRSLYCSALSSAQGLLRGSKYAEELLPTIMMLLLYEVGYVMVFNIQTLTVACSFSNLALDPAQAGKLMPVELRLFSSFMALRYSQVL